MPRPVARRVSLLGKIRSLKRERNRRACAKYQASAKGRAARDRAYAKRKARPGWIAEQLKKLKAWRDAHPDKVRAYNRVLQARLRRERKARAARN